MTKPSGAGRPPNPIGRRTQAERVIARFGSHKQLHTAIQAAGGQSRGLSTIYRWTYPPEQGGTGGTIPDRALRQVIRAARLEGIVLTADDLDPRERDE